MIALRKGQHITSVYHAGPLVRQHPVDPYRTPLDLCGGKAARLEKPRMPKPFIKSQLCQSLGQLFAVF